MRRLYVAKEKLDETIQKITRDQARKNWYVNVRIAPYKGKKYDPANTVCIVIG